MFREEWEDGKWAKTLRERDRRVAPPPLMPHALCFMPRSLPCCHTTPLFLDHHAFPSSAARPPVHPSTGPGPVLLYYVLCI